LFVLWTQTRIAPKKISKLIFQNYHVTKN
jgi:hypothetical protein